MNNESFAGSQGSDLILLMCTVWGRGRKVKLKTLMKNSLSPEHKFHFI